MWLEVAACRRRGLQYVCIVYLFGHKTLSFVMIHGVTLMARENLDSVSYKMLDAKKLARFT